MDGIQQYINEVENALASAQDALGHLEQIHQAHRSLTSHIREQVEIINGSPEDAGAVESATNKIIRALDEL